MDNRSKIRFIYTALIFKDGTYRSPLFCSNNGICLYSYRDMGIRDNRRKKKCVCMTTGRAINTCYCKDKNFIMELNLTFVRTIESKTARKPASAGNLV